MKKEYNFAEMKGRKNPYAKGLKKQVTLRLGIDVIDYFKNLAAETGIPYQNLINLYLRECAQTGKKPTLSWASRPKRAEKQVRLRTASTEPPPPRHKMRRVRVPPAFNSLLAYGIATLRARSMSRITAYPPFPRLL